MKKKLTLEQFCEQMAMSGHGDLEVVIIDAFGDYVCPVVEIVRAKGKADKILITPEED